MHVPPLSLREILGWTREAPAQTWLTLRGDPTVPPSRFGISSTRVFTPRLAVATWRGRQVLGRTAVIPNLFNHRPTPVADGWSVRVTSVRDFRGGTLTYDSHNGTDFACVPGTVVVAAAPGRVVTTRSEYNRGGLKLYLDHGDGLMTTSNHLGRVLVEPGTDVVRGQPVALSAYSGLDALASFPWVAPHVHYNVILGGVLVDPFAAGAEVPLWRGDDGKPAHHAPDGAVFRPTRFDPARVDAVLEDLRHPGRREALAAIPDPYRRAWELTIEATTYPTRFSSPDAARALFEAPARRQALDLPLSAASYERVVFADEVGLR